MMKTASAEEAENVNQDVVEKENLREERLPKEEEERLRLEGEDVNLYALNL
jgi:hypothetical protein